MSLSSRPWAPEVSAAASYPGFGWDLVVFSYCYTECGPYFYGFTTCISCVCNCIEYGTLIAYPPLGILPVGSSVTPWGIIQTTTVSGPTKVTSEVLQNGQVLGRYIDTVTLPANSETIIYLPCIIVPPYPGPVQLSVKATAGKVTAKAVSLPATIQ